MPCHLAPWWAPAETTHLTPQTLRHCARLLRCMLRLRWLHGQVTLHAGRHVSSIPSRKALQSRAPSQACAPAAQLWAAGQALGAPEALADAAAA